MEYECKCIGCNKTPEQIPEYAIESKVFGMSAEEFVKEEEGTYNPKNGHFACTDCYIAMGMPSGPTGWVAP